MCGDICRTKAYTQVKGCRSGMSHTFSLSSMLVLDPSLNSYTLRICCILCGSHTCRRNDACFASGQQFTIARLTVTHEHVRIKICSSSSIILSHWWCMSTRCCQGRTCCTTPTLVGIRACFNQHLIASMPIRLPGICASHLWSGTKPDRDHFHCSAESAQVSCHLLYTLGLIRH